MSNVMFVASCTLASPLVDGMLHVSTNVSGCATFGYSFLYLLSGKTVLSFDYGFRLAPNPIDRKSVV